MSEEINNDTSNAVKDNTEAQKEAIEEAVETGKDVIRDAIKQCVKTAIKETIKEAVVIAADAVGTCVGCPEAGEIIRDTGMADQIADQAADKAGDDVANKVVPPKNDGTPENNENTNTNKTMMFNDKSGISLENMTAPSLGNSTDTLSLGNDAGNSASLTNTTKMNNPKP